MSAEPRNSGPRRPDAGLRWGSRILLATLLVVITDIALQPGFTRPASILGWDKLEHAAAFAALAVFARGSFPQLPSWLLALPLAGYGLWIEYAQASTAVGRTPSVADWVADLIGLVLGFGAAITVRTILEQPRH